ncbi:unnamed protein product [Closterium sp. NIES-54]
MLQAYEPVTPVAREPVAPVASVLAASAAAPTSSPLSSSPSSCPSAWCTSSWVTFDIGRPPLNTVFSTNGGFVIRAVFRVSPAWRQTGAGWILTLTLMP